MSETYVKICVDKLNKVNRDVEAARVAYKNRQYDKVNTLINRSIEKVSDITHHTEVIPDSIDQVYMLTKAFQKLNVPMVLGDTIVYSSCMVPMPVTLNFAGMLFFIYETGRQFIDYSQQLLRVTGKRAAVYVNRR